MAPPAEPQPLTGLAQLPGSEPAAPAAVSVKFEFGNTEPCTHCTGNLENSPAGSSA